MLLLCFFLQAEDGIRYLVRSRGLGDVYKRQHMDVERCRGRFQTAQPWSSWHTLGQVTSDPRQMRCLLYTSDAADERSSVDLGGRRIIKKKKKKIVKFTT